MTVHNCFKMKLVQNLFCQYEVRLIYIVPKLTKHVIHKWVKKNIMCFNLRVWATVINRNNKLLWDFVFMHELTPLTCRWQIVKVKLLVASGASNEEQQSTMKLQIINNTRESLNTLFFWFEVTYTASGSDRKSVV